MKNFGNLRIYFRRIEEEEEEEICNKNYVKKNEVKESKDKTINQKQNEKQNEKSGEKQTFKENIPEKKIEELTNQVIELTKLLKMVQADFENYKKRVEKDNCQQKHYYTTDLIKKILPVMDSFEIALKNKKIDNDSIKGFELIYAQLRSLLKEQGVMPIICCGQKFNPDYHEVMLVEKCKDEKDDEKITEELQKGYLLKDKVIRPSKVKISKS